MRKLALLFIVMLLPLALAQNESEEEGEEVLACGGSLGLELSPTIAAYYQEVTATVSGLENCDGKVANIRLSSCKGTDVTSCEVGGSGCQADFPAPNATATQRYYACVDMNDDGSYGATEMKSATLALRAPTCDELEAIAEGARTPETYAAAGACFGKLVKTQSDIGYMTKCDYYYSLAANTSTGLETAQYLELAAKCRSKDAVKTRGYDLYFACAGAYIDYAYGLERSGDLLNAIAYYGKAAEGCYKNAGETGNVTHYSFLRNTYIVKLQARLNGQNVSIPYNVSLLAANPKLPISQLATGAVSTTEQPLEQQGGSDITVYVVIAVIVVGALLFFAYFFIIRKRMGKRPEEEEAAEELPPEEPPEFPEAGQFEEEK